MYIRLTSLKNFVLQTVIFMTVILAIPAWGASNRSGNCSTFDFSQFRPGGVLKWAGLARVTRNDASVFAEATGKKQLGFVFFNQQAEILAEEKDRLKIRALRFKGKEEITGWADKIDMLCQNLPIKSDAGLEIKFFIKTNMEARTTDHIPTVQVFQDPELKDCVGGQGNCREGASRFHMYFVFEETEKAYLLADRFRLEDDDLLLGWVAKKDGFLWNNAYSIRPADNLTAPDGSGPGTICTYERLEDAVAKNQKACHPVVGGNKWFQSALRIPVLDMVDENNKHMSPTGVGAQSSDRRFFKVALARPGLVGRRVSDDKVAISTGLAAQIMPGFQSLSAKKSLDIFFLLDATASMEPVIDAVRGTDAQRGVIQEIIQTLKNAQGFRETQFRFGFRVYRDPYADKSTPDGISEGVGEGHPLPAACDMNDEQRQAAFLSFQRAISKVQVSSDDAEDDYPENLFGGLAQAVGHDLRTCPDHLKVLFVIGDNGYQATRPQFDAKGRIHQVAKYLKPITIESLVELMRGGGRTAGVEANNTVHFFIQTPSREKRVKHPKAYQKAYDQFTAQAKYLLRHTLPSDSSLDDHLFRMGENRLVQRMVGTVEKLGSSALINEIILDIRGGAALTQVIQRLRRERIDIPGVYWHILKQGACGELGKQCEQRIFDTTRIGFIEADDHIAEELWVTSSALSSWIRILRGFEGYFNLPEAQLRRALISALILGLQQEIRRPPIDVSGETPAEYAQRRGGLPVRSHSPLLSYHVNSLSAEKTSRDKDGHLIILGADGSPMKDKNGQIVPAVPACELRRLALWAIKSKEMLETVERDYMRPVFQTAPYPTNLCPDATINGQHLSRVVGDIQHVPLGPDKTYRFGHTFGGRRGYWIPQEFLP